jgi:hypothetical protein
MDQEEQAKNWQQIVARAWVDEAFKARLLSEPATVLTEGGVELPPGVEVRIGEDTDSVLHLVLPRRPADGELSADQLEKVAGGVGVPVYDGSSTLGSRPTPWSHACPDDGIGYRR